MPDPLAVTVLSRTTNRLPSARLSSRIVRRAAWVSVAAALAALYLLAQERLAIERAHLGEAEELIYAPPPAFLDFASLGYRHALANVLWFRTINYFGRHYRTDRVYPWLAEMCERVTDLDPRAEHVYRFAGLILPWEANEIDAGIALLEKGARNLPDSWQMHYLLGFSYYFFRDDLDRASRSLRTALSSPGAPQFLAGLLAVIEAAHRGPQQALEFLQTAHASAQLPEMKEMLRQQIDELRFARDLGELQRLVDLYREQTGRIPSDWTELMERGWLTARPVDPFGDRYVIDPQSGRVGSESGRQPKRLGSSQMREAILRGSTPRGGGS